MYSNERTHAEDGVVCLTERFYSAFRAFMSFVSGTVIIDKVPNELRGSNAVSIPTT